MKKTRSQWEDEFWQAIEAGDEAKADAIAEVLGERPSADSLEHVQAAGQALVRGATMNWNDELGGMIASAAQQVLLSDEERESMAAAGLPIGYEGMRDKLRRQDRRLQEVADQGNYGLPLEFVGGMALPGVGAMKSVAGLAPLTRAALLGGEGAAHGGLSGAGAAEEDVAGSAITGALVGGASGFGLPLVAPRVTQLIGEGIDKLTMSPVQRAEQKIGAEMIGEGIMTGGEAAQALQDLGPPAMLADLAPGAAVQSMSRAGPGALADDLAQRGREQLPRVQSILEDTIGARADDFEPMQDALQQSLNRAGEAYEPLRQSLVPVTDDLRDFISIDTPLVKGAVKAANDAFVERGRPPITGDEEMIPADWMEEIYRNLRNKSYPNPGKRAKSKHERAAKLAANMREMVDQADGGYVTARKGYREASGALDALGGRKGQKPTEGGRGYWANLGRSDVAQDEAMAGFGALSPENADIFRVGAARGIAGRLAKDVTETGNLASLFRPGAEGGQRLKMLETIAQSDEAFQRGQQALLGESQMAQGAQYLGRGTNSRTQPRMADLARGSRSMIDIVADVIFPAGLTQETAEAMRDLLRRGDFSEQDLDRMIRRAVREGLFEATPQQIDAWMQLVAAPAAITAGGALAE